MVAYTQFGGKREAAAAITALKHVAGDPRACSLKGRPSVGVAVHICLNKSLAAAATRSNAAVSGSGSSLT
jgi:hypothetical protein